MTVRVPSVAVLRNRGIPITLHALVKDDEGNLIRPYSRQYDGESEEAEPVLETSFLQFTNAVLADLESDDVGFGSMDAWQDALGVKPFVTLTRTLAITMEWWVPGAAAPGTGAPVPDLRRAGKAMLDGQTDDYSTIVGTAFALANGVDPERALDLLKAGVRNAKELRPLIDAELDKMLAEEELAIAKARAALAGDDTQTSPTDAATPGSSGSPVGSEPAEPSTSSGG